MRKRLAPFAYRILAFGSLTAALIAGPASAQCWSGGESGKGVPRESLLVLTRRPSR